MEIRLPARSVPVLTEVDVLVCGGGPAGVTAAVCAARHGARVALIERWPSVGGMASNALVTGWHRSDREKVVINGLVEEAAERLRRSDPNWIWRVSNYPRAHETHWFDPEGMRIVYQRLLDDAGVQTYCNLVAGEPVLDGNRLTAVLVETKRGLRAIRAKYFVDSTGDADLAAKSGATCDFGRESDGRVQGMTMMFELGGQDAQRVAAWTDEQFAGYMAKMVAERDAGRFPPFNVGNTRGSLRAAAWPRPEPGPRFYWNMCPVAGDPLDEAELSRLTALSRERIMAYLEYWRRELPGYEKAELIQSGFALGVRESRRLRGVKRLDDKMVLGAVKHADAVGHGVWMIDIHDPVGTGYTTHTAQDARTMLKTGTSYHIPLGIALTPAVPNLAVACRAASTTHEAHSSFRVQTHLMALAQGVGTCAALALAQGGDLAAVPLPKLQAALRADGVYLEDVPAA